VTTLHQRLILATHILLYGRLEPETYLSLTENHIVVLKPSPNTQQSVGSAQKIGSAGLVETNNFCTPYKISDVILAAKSFICITSSNTSLSVFNLMSVHTRRM